MRKIIATTMVTAVALGAVAPAASLAAEIGKANTKGIVTFEKSSEIPNPVDPTKPDPDPIDPDPEHPGTNGLLRFDWLPVFDFGSVKHEGKAVFQPVKQDKYTLTTPTETFYAAPTVEISDARGNNDGWHAKVTASDFVLMTKDTVPVPETGADAAILDGAKVSISAATINTHSGIVGKKPTSGITTANPLVIGGGSAAQQFVGAAKDDGMSQWSVGFSDDVDNAGYLNKHNTQGTDDNIKLSVPAATKKLEGRVYQSTITWSLEDTPA